MRAFKFGFAGRTFSPSRWLIAPIIALTALSMVGPARADGSWTGKKVAQTDKKRSCTGAHREAMTLERAGRLRQAKDALAVCAKPLCSSFIRQECTNRYMRLESEIPSVVLVVMDGAGEPLTDVEVKMDGEALTSRLDGHGLEVDPGLHEFSFLSNGRDAVKQKMMIMQGQRNRPISVALRTPEEIDREKEKAMRASEAALGSKEPSAAQRLVLAEPPPAVDSNVVTTHYAPVSRGPSAWTYLFAGTGVAAFGSGALLTYWGRKDNQKLGDCSPMCMTNSVDHVKRLYLAADIAYGVGVAAIGASVIALIASKGEPAPSEYGVGIVPTKAGAVTALSGRF
jgi:hypothetical protein